MAFLFVFFSMGIVTIILIFSKIRIEMENVKLNTNAKTLINEDYMIKIKFFILGAIPIFKISITEYRLKKFKIKEKAHRLESKLIENINGFDKKILTKISIVSKNLKIDIKEIEFKMELSTENAGFTAILVALISTIISVYLSNKMEKAKKQKFQIIPIYINQNLINMRFSGIFEVKMFHIINIVYILMKSKGEDKNERTSNRGAYDYSYE